MPESLLSKLATVLVFEFEARMQLSSWADLTALIETAERYHISHVPLSCMADLILSNHEVPTELLFKVIEALSNLSLSSNDRDVKRLARWFRLLFGISLSRDQTALDDFASKLLEIIRDHSAEYPQDEVQWPAVVSFNHAVDMYGAGNVERCHRLCEIALKIGNFAQDEYLKALIRENYQTIITSL